MSLKQSLRERWTVFVPLIGVWVVVLLVAVLYFIVDQNLFSEPQFGNTVLDLTPFVFAAFAQATVMLSSGVDLSIGAVISLITCLMATHHSAAAVLLSLAVGVAIGLWNGVFVVFLRVPAIVVTLANSFVVSGIALMVLPTPGGVVSNGILNFGSSIAILPAALWSWIIALLLWAYFKRSKAGVAFYAIGNNSDAARASGVNVSSIRLMGWGIAGAFGALAGIALSVQTSTGDPTVGVPFTLSSIAAAVVGGVSFFGGKGTLRGALAGAIIVGAITNLLFFLGISQFAQYIVEGLVLVGALAIGQLNLRRRAVS